MGTLERPQWPRRDGPGTGTLAQAWWHSHVHNNNCRARWHRRDSTITMASARWHGHGACCDVYVRRIHALSTASPTNIFWLVDLDNADRRSISNQMRSGTHNNYSGFLDCDHRALVVVCHESILISTTG